jgi:hypothetical protein
MKKLLLSLLSLAAVSAYAYSFQYLTFETTDGIKVSISVTDLTMTFCGNTLVAGDKTFAINNLKKMYFSTSDDTTTSISKITDVQKEDITEIYDLQGKKVNKNRMKNGIYVARTKSGTYKITVK